MRSLPWLNSSRQVWASDLEIGAHRSHKLLDGDIGSLGFVAEVEIAQNITDGASGRMRWCVCHAPTLLTSTFPIQFSRATVISHALDPQISAIPAD